MYWASQGFLGKESEPAGDVGLVPQLEDLLKKEMATHSITLAWEIPWTEKSGGLQFIGLQSRTRLKRLILYACVVFNVAFSWFCCQSHHVFPLS